MSISVVNDENPVGERRLLDRAKKLGLVHELARVITFSRFRQSWGSGKFMTVIKRKKGDLKADLLVAIDRFASLLEAQKEEEAVAALRAAAVKLRGAQPDTTQFTQAVAEVLDAFEGDHELSAYTHQRDESNEWTDADELSSASYKVLSLVRRMQ